MIFNISIYPEYSLKCCELQNISSPLLGPKLVFYDPFELLGSDWAFSLLQDLDFCLLTSSLRYLESQKNINFSKEALGIPSSWHSACIACFMPDAGNTPLLEGCLELFESQKNFVQIFYGPLLLSTQERQHDNPSLEDSHASQSHVLEPYFHPEITEVGTLPSLGAVRVTCVGKIQIADGVGQKRRDFEEMTWAVFLQGHRRDFTAASVRIAAEYLIRALIIHSRKPASEERWKRHHAIFCAALHTFWSKLPSSRARRICSSYDEWRRVKAKSPPEGTISGPCGIRAAAEDS